MTAYIGYDTIQNNPNLLTSTELIGGGGEDSSYPISNCLDYSTYTYTRSSLNPAPSIIWRFNLASEITINYVALASHTLPELSRVQILNHAADTLIAEIQTTGRGPQLLTFPSWLTDPEGFAIRWRAEDQVSNIDWTLGSLYVGTLTQLPQGILPPFVRPSLARSAVAYPSVGAKGGEYLGSHIERVGWEFNIRQDNVSPTWVDQVWPTMVRHMEQRPFFFSWDNEGFPNDCVYAWIDGKIRPPRYTNPIHKSFDLKCRGLHVV